jgi:hypothetical protein
LCGLLLNHGYNNSKFLAAFILFRGGFGIHRGVLVFKRIYSKSDLSSLCENGGIMTK